MLENKNFMEVYKELYPDFPNENSHLPASEIDQFRTDAYEEFVKFRIDKLQS